MTIMESVEMLRQAGLPVPSIEGMVEEIERGEYPVGTPELGYSARHKEFHPTSKYISEASRIEETIKKGYKILESVLQLASGDASTPNLPILEDELAMEMARMYMESPVASSAADSLKSCMKLGAEVYPLPSTLVISLFTEAITSPSAMKWHERDGNLQKLGLLYRLGDEGLPLDKRYISFLVLQQMLQ